MQELYKQLIKKKKGNEKPDELEQHAKMGVLKDIHKMASDDLGHDIHGIKKVSVMSTDDAGMQEGLKKAGEFLAHKPGHSMSDDDADRVSDDMHQESQRHKLDKKSEMSDQKDSMANKMGDEEDDSDKAMEGYAEGGMINPGQYGEAEADEKGTPHQNLQSQGMNTKYAEPTIRKEKGSARNYAQGGSVEHQHDQTTDFMENGPEEMAKEWGPGKNYADGGMVKNRFGDPHGDDASEPHDVEHQSMQHNNMFGAAGPTISKEQGSANPHLKGSGKDMHNNRPMADQNVDDYGDLDDSDIEALIKHLQSKRKSAPTF